MTALANRLKLAAFGLAITVAPLVIIAAAQQILLPRIVQGMEGLARDEVAWAVSSLRRDWLILHAAAATLAAIYWLLAALLGRSRILDVRAANVTLAMFALEHLAATLYGSLVQWPEGLKGLCQIFGISDAYRPAFSDADRLAFGFDVPSSCGAFTYAVHQIILLGVLGLPFVILTASLVIRITASRRTALDSGRRGGW